MDSKVGIEDRRETVVAKPNNITYVLAVMFMMGLGVCSIVVLTMIRPDKDNSMLITTIIGFLGPTTLSLLAFMKSQETHLSVNSRLDAFMANAKLASYAKGMSDGRLEGRQSADNRTDELARGILSPPISVEHSNESGIPVKTLENIEKNTKDTVQTLKDIKKIK